MKEFWNGLMLLRKQYAHRIEPLCHEWGITRAELDVLLFLTNAPELNRATDIVELQGLTKSHVSIAVKALCKRGYLVLTQDSADRRVSRLEVTEAAKELIEVGDALQKAYFAELFGCLTPQELEQFKAVQRKLMSRMHEMSNGD